MSKLRVSGISILGHNMSQGGEGSGDDAVSLHVSTLGTGCFKLHDNEMKTPMKTPDSARKVNSTGAAAKPAADPVPTNIKPMSPPQETTGGHLLDIPVDVPPQQHKEPLNPQINSPVSIQS